MEKRPVDVFRTRIRAPCARVSRRGDRST